MTKAGTPLPSPLGLIDNNPHGVDVPTPIFPPLLMRKYGFAVVVPTTNAGTPLPSPLAATVSIPHGVVVPSPKNAAVVKVEVAVPPKNATVEEICVVDAFPLKITRVVVADCPEAGCVKGSLPPPVPCRSVPQIMFPEESVSTAVQEASAARLIVPFASRMPFANVDVAVVEETFNVDTERPPSIVDVALVEVATNDVNAIVEVAIKLPLPLLATSAEVERFVEPVPPFATGSVPLTCDVSVTSPESVECVRQLPEIAKHPAARLKPPPVETMVEVEVVKFAIALMLKSEPGVEVPMPTLPAFVTTKFVAVELPIANDGPVMPLGLTDRSAQGDDVANPENCVDDVAMIAEMYSGFDDVAAIFVFAES